MIGQHANRLLTKAETGGEAVRYRVGFTSVLRRWFGAAAQSLTGRSLERYDVAALVAQTACEPFSSVFGQKKDMVRC